MIVAMIQMPVADDKARNLRCAEAYIAQAKSAGADLAVLPEMFTCPYLASNFPHYAEEEGGESWQRMAEAAAQHGITLVAGSMPERDEDGRVYNTSYAFDPHGIPIAKHRKMHLFDIDVTGGQRFRESDTLSPGNDATTFDTPFGVLGLCVCYDFRFPELCRLMIDRGAVAIVVPGAFNMTTGPAHWELLFRSRAVDNQVFTVGVAPARQNDGVYVSFANSIAVSPWGRVLARMDEREGMALSQLEPAEIERVRSELPLLAHRRRDVYACGPANT